MKTKTWAYGTTREGKVEAIVGSGASTTHIVSDEHHEGHVMTAGAFDENAAIGDKVRLVFTKGGPTGGYWKATKV